MSYFNAEEVARRGECIGTMESEGYPDVPKKTHLFAVSFSGDNPNDAAEVTQLSEFDSFFATHSTGERGETELKLFLLSPADASQCINL